MKKLLFAATMFVAGVLGAQTSMGTVNLAKCDNGDFKEVDWRFLYNADSPEPFFTLFTDEVNVTLNLVEFVGKEEHEWGTSVRIKCVYEANNQPCILVLMDFINGDSGFSFIDKDNTCSFFIDEFHKTERI